MSLYRPNNLLLVLACALLLTLFVALQWTHVTLIAILTIPLVLYLPGYALSVALLGRNRVSSAERFLWSVGLSLALAIVGGVLLSLTPWGLQTTTWVILLLAITGIAGGFALLRRYEPLATSLQVPRLRISVGDIAFIEFALIALVAAIQIARIPAPAASVNGYTSLWVLPGDTTTHIVQFGFTSQETQRVNYELVVQVNGKPAQTFPNITLQPGDKWENSFDATNVPSNAQIEAVLNPK
jgi:uncharacterized membrane protein